MWYTRLGRMADVTQLPNALEQGSPAAGEQLLPRVYLQSRRLAPRT